MIKLYFDEEPNLLPQKGMPKINSLSRVCDNPDWHYDMHQHDDQCEIMYVSDGAGSYVINNRQYHVKQGDVLAVNAHVIHAEASDPEHPIAVWVCALSHLHLAGRAENTLIPSDIEPVLHAGALAEEIAACYEEIFAERQARSVHYMTMSQLAACRLVTLVQRLAADAPPMVRSPEHPLSTDVKLYIDAHFMEPITLEHLSQVFHVSLYHIVHEMKKDVGESPINYLIKRRIGEAQRMLLGSQLTVAEIAQAVGYGNVSYFMTLFGRRVGMTPTQFRELYLLADSRT